jgi:hypothetical protein
MVGVMEKVEVVMRGVLEEVEVVMGGVLEVGELVSHAVSIESICDAPDSSKACTQFRQLV